MSARRWLSIVALLWAWPGRTASAQSCITPTSALSIVRTCSVTVTTNAPSGGWIVARLGTMTLSSAANYVVTPPTVAAYDANIFQEPAGNTRTLTVSANAPWTITVAPSTAGNPSYWTAANDATYGAFVAAEVNKPSSELKVSTTLGSGYLALPTLTSGSTTLLSAQPAIGGRAVTVYFATVWSYQYDTPGGYTLPFKFSLTVQ